MDDHDKASGSSRVDEIVVSGKVKWFDAVKGYGFIVPNEGGGDVLLHKTVLREASRTVVMEGASIVCSAMRGPKGLQATRIVELDESTAQPAPRRMPRSPQRHPGAMAHEAAIGEGESVDATVKWFNRARGYGFLTQSDNAQDIFIHVECLRQHGVEELQPGQQLRVRVARGPKGPMVTAVEHL